MTERHGRTLAALQARAARLAEELCDRALAAEDDHAACELAKAFHAVGRGLRQTIALEQRLEREAAEAHRQAREAASAERARAVEDRKRQVRIAVRPLAWTECERFDFTGCDDEEAAFHREYGALLDRAERLVEDEAAADPGAFLGEPLTRQVERLAARLGLGEADRHSADAPSGEGWDGEGWHDDGARPPAAVDSS